MVELLRQTLSDPAVLWAAVEAVGTVLATLIGLLGIILVLPQLRRIKQESISHRIESVRWALENYLEAAELGTALDDLLAAVSSDEGYPRGVFNKSAEVLRLIQPVEKMIQEGYIDKDLLIELVGRQLASIYDVIDDSLDLASRKHPAANRRGVEILYPEVWRLLREAKEAARSEDLEAFARIAAVAADGFRDQD